MGKIKQLSENTVNKIAAGEVVERPLSIVKELVENSLDAGSENITIEIEKGGKKRIRVKDDGCGLSIEDIYMAFERHATSKLSSIEDLSSISTMGFRGEAIPSIASVTRFSMASATEHGNGYRISLENGRIVSESSCSIPKGTEVTADNIFFNIPARKKFLKSDEREHALVREMVQKFAVVSYDTAFSLYHNGKAVFQYPASTDRLARVLHVWKAVGNDVKKSMSVRDNVSVTAFVPSPFSSFPGISVISVNGRIVSDRFINSVIYKTFRETIGGEFKSPVVLEIVVAPGEVDINVHPSKMEVRFQDPKLIMETIRESITKAVHSFREQDEDRNTVVPGMICEREPRYSISKEDGFIHGKLGSDKTVMIENSPVFTNIETGDLIQESFYDLKIKDYKVIGTAFGVYIIVESKDRLIFLDQHASHERVTFYRLQLSTKNKSGLSQLLIVPVIIKMSSKELSIMEEASDFFNEVGFVIEKFDDESAIMRAIPALGFDADWESTVKELIGELENYGEGYSLNDKLLSLLAVTACRSSVKSNDLISEKEIEQLIDDVNKSNVVTCPHGRPFFFVLKKNEMEKQVNRR